MIRRRCSGSGRQAALLAVLSNEEDRQTTQSSVDTTATVDAMAQRGWAQLKLPARPAPPEDPEVIESAVEVVARLVGRGATLTCERHAQGRALEHGDVAVAASHRSQVAAIRQPLHALGLAIVKVDTADKLQGLEFDGHGRFASPRRAAFDRRVPSGPWSALRNALATPARMHRGSVERGSATSLARSRRPASCG